MSLDPTAQDSSHGFNTTTRILQTDVKTIHAFSGSLFLTSDGAGRLHVWNINNPQIKVEFRNSEQVRMTEPKKSLWNVYINPLFVRPFSMLSWTRNLL